VHLAELAGNQRIVVGQAAGGADRDVEAFGQQVDATRRQIKLQAHFRVGRGILQEQPGQIELDEIGRHRDAQHTAWRRLAMLGDGGGGLGLLKQALGVVEDALAEFGDAQATCAARQQALAELGFERRQAARQRRFRQTGAFGGTREAACLHDQGEQQQIVGIQAHGGSLVH